MSYGHLDQMVSHRGMWEKCEWWRRSTFGDSVPKDEIVYEQTPAGVFYAAGGTISKGDSTLGPFVYQQHYATIITNDDLREINKKDLVSYKGKIWLVQQVVATQTRVRSQYTESETFTFQLTLTR